MAISTIGSTCIYVSFGRPRRCPHITVCTTGTRVCVAQTLMPFDRGAGSKWTKKWNLSLGHMGTIMLRWSRQVLIPISLSSSFSGGVRSRVGWCLSESNICHIIPSLRGRLKCNFYSVIEMQVFLVTFVRKFAISPADYYPQIWRAKSGLLIPAVLGEEYKGTQLPLKITASGARRWCHEFDLLGLVAHVMVYDFSIPQKCVLHSSGLGVTQWLRRFYDDPCKSLALPQWRLENN